ncbi:MAG TPA: hypothetical protein VGB85_05625 [Nannocystis sp.]
MNPWIPVIYGATPKATSLRLVGRNGDEDRGDPGDSNDRNPVTACRRVSRVAEILKALRHRKYSGPRARLRCARAGRLRLRPTLDATLEFGFGYRASPLAITEVVTLGAVAVNDIFSATRAVTTTSGPGLFAGIGLVLAARCPSPEFKIRPVGGRA